MYILCLGKCIYIVVYYHHCIEIVVIVVQQLINLMLKQLPNIYAVLFPSQKIVRSAKRELTKDALSKFQLFSMN